jgi:hypothetical protein
MADTLRAGLCSRRISANMPTSTLRARVLAGDLTAWWTLDKTFGNSSVHDLTGTVEHARHTQERPGRLQQPGRSFVEVPGLVVRPQSIFALAVAFRVIDGRKVLHGAREKLDLID